MRVAGQQIEAQFAIDEGDAADLGASVSFAIAQSAIPGQLSVFVQYDATIAAHQTNNAVVAGLKLIW
jgi:hypothetical protein